MNDQLEHELAESFHRRADTPVDTAALAAGATRKGRRLRVRTRVAQCVAGVAALAVLAGVGTVVANAVQANRPRPGLDAATSPGPSGRPSPDTPAKAQRPVPALPVVAGAPGAKTAPDKVGTDPNVVHFGLAGATTDADDAVWASLDGLESVDVGLYVVEVTRSPAALDAVRDYFADGYGDPYIPGEVTGMKPVPAPDVQKPVKVGDLDAVHSSWSNPDVGNGTSYLRWQPVPGLWAQVTMWTIDDKTGNGSSANQIDTLAGAVKLGTQLRLDTAYRCLSQVELTRVPQGAQLLSCRIWLPTAKTTTRTANEPNAVPLDATGLLTVGSGASRLRIETGPSHNPDQSVNATVAGQPAHLGDDQVGARALGVWNLHGLSVTIHGTGSYGDQVLKDVMNGIQGNGADDPAKWPTKIIG
jgi:hypothetical protein